MRALPLTSLALSAALLAHSQTPHPAFDAASVKPSDSATDHGSEYNFPHGGLAIRNGDVKGILQAAFSVQDFLIIGAPSWTAHEHYDIFAKSSPDPESKATAVELASEARRKLQTLLADRFQLIYHRETRELPVYRLTVAKGGPKITALPPEAKSAGIRGRCGLFEGTGTSIGNLAFMLSRELGSLVTDQTGLTGRYNFRLEYAPTIPCQRPPDIRETVPDAPSVFAALQEQLGLKLEAGKAPTEVIVIDRIERPSAN